MVNAISLINSNMPSPGGEFLRVEYLFSLIRILHEWQAIFNGPMWQFYDYCCFFFTFSPDGSGLAEGWSPIRLLAGQTLKIGHFLQPTARAMGHSVISGSPDKKQCKFITIMGIAPIEAQHKAFHARSEPAEIIRPNLHSGQPQVGTQSKPQSRL